MTKKQLNKLDYEIGISCEVLFEYGCYDEIQGFCIAQQLIAEDLGYV